MKYIINIGAWQTPAGFIKQYLNKNEYKVFLLEAQPLVAKRLSENSSSFSNVEVINCAITSKDGRVSFYSDVANIQPDGSYCSHSSINKQYLIDYQHPQENIKEFEVDGLTLESFLRKKNIYKEKIEFLYIDCEGHEHEIITNIDFSELDIDNISYEHVHTDGVMQSGQKNIEIQNHLRKYGFNRFSGAWWDGSDTIASRK